MQPHIELRPPQLDGLRVAAVFGPEAASRASALQLLTDAPAPGPIPPPEVPGWVRRNAPWLGRFWGEGLTTANPLTLHEPIFRWAEDDPEGLLAAARSVAAGTPPDPSALDRARRGIDAGTPLAELPGPEALLATIDRYPQLAANLLRARPEALVEAVEILIARPDDVRLVLSRYPYTDPEALGGPLDRGMAGEGAP